MQLEALTPGTYKILYRGSELGAARTWMTVPSSRIFVDNVEKGEYAKWRVAPESANGDLVWHIRNAVVEDFFVAEPKVGAKIIGRREEDEVREALWRLEEVGKDTYRIGYPGTDLVWTTKFVPMQIPGRLAWEIFLRERERADGIPEQEFKFVLLSAGAHELTN